MDKQKNIPVLRFPEFSEDWESKKLGELLEFKNGINASKEQYGRGVKFINVLDILNNEFITYDSIIGSVDVDANTAKKYPVNYGDILFQRSSETREEVGSACVYLDKEKTATFGGFVIRGRKNGEYNPVFLNKLLKTDLSRNEITARSGGSTRYNVGQEILSSISLLFPKIFEQDKIATFLSSIDEKLQALKKKKSLLEQYKKGVMQKIFSQEIRFKDENGEGFPDWKEKKLGDIALVKSGLSKDQNDNYLGYKVTRIETISESIINLNKVGFVETTSDIEDYKLNIGDILFSNINSVSHIGKTAIVKEDINLYHGMNLLCLRSNGLIIPMFLFYFLNLDKLRNYFKSICNQAVSQASINQTELSKTPLMLPKLEEQTKIANFLSAIDEKISHCQTQIEKTDQYKKGLLQQMFC